MPPTRPPYPPDLRRQIVELVRAGRSPAELAREFESTAADPAIHKHEARLAIFSYIEGWYNPHRRHSSIAYYAPIAYEKLHLSQAWNTSPKYSTEAG